jgi:hypothetical protein
MTTKSISGVTVSSEAMSCEIYNNSKINTNQ